MHVAPEMGWGGGQWQGPAYVKAWRGGEEMRDAGRSEEVGRWAGNVRRRMIGMKVSSLLKKKKKK